MLFRSRARENKLGYISEVTDTRTGEVYTNTSTEFVDDALSKGALGISIFPSIKDESMMPYLKKTQVGYHETNILVKNTWKVNFELQKDAEVTKLPVDVLHTEPVLTVHITYLTFSIFWLTLYFSLYF